ncbi:MAG: hypothetical protein LBJ86_05070 [Spirochaetaceae bacterium]|jgi:hypothetical protein|nr:hypothetical protein [Spirochaetaceae bacterium]
MGRKKTNRKQGAEFIKTLPVRKFCPCCKGGDGNSKEIYDTREDALQTAEHIGRERGVSLKVYQCGSGNGWHLTKGNDDSGINDDSMNMPQKDYFPRYSAYNSRVKWELVDDDAVTRGMETVSAVRSKSPPEQPDNTQAIRVECGTGSDGISFSGVVVEIVKNISIEKIFNINLDNPIPASLAKVFLDDEHQQITVHAKSGGRAKSFTALVKKTALQKHNIKIGDSVSIAAAVKRINRKSVWHCVSITRACQ